MSDAPYVMAFICWGKPLYSQEVAFCLHSAMHWLGDRIGQIRFVAYTDNPALLAGLPIEIVTVSPEQLREWRGPADFLFRPKMFVLADALKRFGKPAVLADSDTYFIKNPLKMFRRIKPGVTLMHVWESVLADSPDPDYSTIAGKLIAAPLRDSRGEIDPISPQMRSWNAGVIGLHPADAGLLPEVVHTCDEMLKITGVRTAEQLAFTHVFSHRTKLRQAWGVIYHYHTWRLRGNFFVNELPKLMEAVRAIPPAEQTAWLYARRPRARFRRRVRVNVEHALRRLGFLKNKVVFTSESY